MGVFTKSSWVTAYFQVKMLFIAVPTLNLYSLDVIGCSVAKICVVQCSHVVGYVN